MRILNSRSWTRMALAAVVILSIVGSRMALAGGSGPTPRSARILGASGVTQGTTANYELVVTFSNGSTDFFTSPPATFSANKGSFSGDIYTAPPVPGYDLLTAKFTQNGAHVTANFVVTIY